MLNVKISRFRYGNKSTQGLIFIDGKFAGCTLENPDMGNQPSISCIPTGVYRLGLRTVGGWNQKAANHSRIGPNHEGMIEVQDVPGRTYILMHWGNEPKNTEGCVLIGTTYQPDYIGSSVDAYISFYDQVIGRLISDETAMLRIEDM